MPTLRLAALCGTAFMWTTAARAQARAQDSVVVSILNTMPHPWDFYRDTAASAAPIGHADANGFAQIVVRDFQGDSVTLYAVSQMGRVSQTFATHVSEAQSWRF